MHSFVEQPDPEHQHRGHLAALDRALGRVVAAASALVLPVSLLLFLQWPLREYVQSYSREANDLAQILFALYVSIAITAATRHHSHLAADAFARRYSGTVRFRLARLGALLVLIPWSLFVLYAAWPGVAQSVRQLEGFPETFNPGYFVIRIALLLLVLLTLLQGVVEACRAPGRAPA
jgi:TRAP-type mannitol/chloroaromatic compound transport system permease small subunit